MIALYYYENLTLREIGEVLGVTESRISQLHTKAVLRLRSHMSEEELRPRGEYRRPLHEERERETMHKPADQIRNVALVGHRGTGKTSLHEALLFEAGAVNRLGSVIDGTTVSDADERRAGPADVDLGGAVVVRVAGRKINLIDTPGEPTFVADALGALRVCESAVFVVNAVMGVEVSTTRLWQRADELDLARLVFVNMLDRERADFFRTLDSLKSAFGPHVVATEIPIGSEHDFRGLIDLVDMKAYEFDGDGRGNASEIPIPDELAEQAQEYREKLMDEVAENSDALMERYLEGEEISHEEIVAALKEGTNHGDIFPVTCGVATRNLGTNRLLDAIVEDLPSPVKHGALELERAVARARRGRRPLRLRLQDPRRPVRRAHQPLPRLPGRHEARHARWSTRARTSKERIGQLIVFSGKETEHVDDFGPGDIGAVAKLKETNAGDWLPTRGAGRGAMPRSSSRRRSWRSPSRPRRKGDEDKVFTALRRLQEEDPTIDLHRDPQTGDQIVAGLSQVHVEVIVERHEGPLRRRGRAQAAARALPGGDPQGRPRPTGATRSSRAGAASSATATSRSSRSRTATSFEFVNEIKGGVIPTSSSPRSRRASSRRWQHGTVAGYPVKGVEVRALRRPVPLGRLLGDGVQARRLAGHEAGARAGRRRYCSSRSCR